jgi:hypothetical protein
MEDEKLDLSFLALSFRLQSFNSCNAPAERPETKTDANLPSSWLESPLDWVTMISSWGKVSCAGDALAHHNSARLLPPSMYFRPRRCF